MGGGHLGGLRDDVFINKVYIQYSLTKAPTTKAPTTKAPTTKAPTTKIPTTKAPSMFPTKTPTIIPTNVPTTNPTKFPTMSPTDNPFAAITIFSTTTQNENEGEVEEGTIAIMSTSIFIAASSHNTGSSGGYLLFAIIFS